MEQTIRIGMDTSKSVFQLHGVNAAEELVLKRRLRRSDVCKFYSKIPATVIGLEACGGSHHWARTLSEMGHEVRLIPAQYVKPYVKRNKNDAADAEAVCEAMSRPTMRYVPVKSAARQAALMIVSRRERLIKTRTQVANAIRGHALEFGHSAPKGLQHIKPLLARIDADETVPEVARKQFRELGDEFADVHQRVSQVNAELKAWHRSDALSCQLTQIPGIGEISASLMVLKTPNPDQFKTARDYSAWIGLTPKDHSTANRRRIGAITRAGDEMLRSAMVSGALSVIQQVQRGAGTPSPWLAGLLARKEPREAAVALANKNGRIAWKMMTTGEDYDPHRARPAMEQAA